MTKEMFINAQRDECRIAIVADGALNELYVERASSQSYVGNVYKGRVTNVEPSIQAAFVDFGKIKNGFLHISDLHPQYFPGGGGGGVANTSANEAVGKKRARRDRPPIQACLRRGQEVIVQVTKEGIGTKGATLSTYLSVPGRYLVLMPGMHRLGVSRKIEDEDSRHKMRQILEELKPPAELGFIVRTAGVDRPKSDLQRDLHYLLRLWRSISQRIKESKIPSEIYQESDLVIRTIRDVYNTDIQRIVCDDLAVACKIKEFLSLTMPRTASRVDLYTDEVGLFHSFGLEQEIENINSARVPLPSGGSLVIDQAEALVAIDVNSGRFRDTDDAESMAYRINSEAAHEVARQLRLRDLGGVIVIDFIDMLADRHRRGIEKIIRDEMKKDRARTKLLRMSQFCIVEMTRQRVRPSLTSSVFRPCPHCSGLGRIKSEESQSLAVMRTLRLAASDERVARIELSVPPAVADHILNHRRLEIVQLEQNCQVKITVKADEALPAGKFILNCTDTRGLAMPWDAANAMGQQPKQTSTREIIKQDVEEYTRQHGLTGQEPHAEPAGDNQPLEAAIERAEKALAAAEREGAGGEAIMEERQAPSEEGEEAVAEALAGEEGPAVEVEAPAGEVVPQSQAAPSDQTSPHEQPAGRQPRAAQPQRQAMGQVPDAPGAAGQPGQPGQDGEGQRRRRRRGGRRHRRHGQGGLPGQEQPQGQSQGQRPPQRQPQPSHRPPVAAGATARPSPSVPATASGESALPAEHVLPVGEPSAAEQVPTAPATAAQAGGPEPSHAAAAGQQAQPGQAAPGEGRHRRRHRGGRRHRRGGGQDQQGGPAGPPQEGVVHDRAPVAAARPPMAAGASQARHETPQPPAAPAPAGQIEPRRPAVEPVQRELFKAAQRPAPAHAAAPPPQPRQAEPPAGRRHEAGEQPVAREEATVDRAAPAPAGEVAAGDQAAAGKAKPKPKRPTRRRFSSQKSPRPKKKAT